ncbi:MAG: hypothetical protein DRP11_00430 [Candidatus Aenigmatarchaeota archaeon]|nr:MAG: hypothetical protein DRP11_00430 [Candidatus Aenigmarchaeota archaeon]
MGVQLWSEWWNELSEEKKKALRGRKVCPFINATCMEDGCMLWDKETEQCVVKALLEFLRTEKAQKVLQKMFLRGGK